MSSLVTAPKDSQQTELFGRSFLLNQLVTAGFEVALPLRDRGVDLIVYQERDVSGQFIARPIQMKAASIKRFDIEKKFERTHDLLIVFVWHLNDSSKTCVYALTYKELFEIAERRKYTDTDAWQKEKGKYNITRPGVEIEGEFAAYKMVTPADWIKKLKV